MSKKRVRSGLDVLVLLIVESLRGISSQVALVTNTSFAHSHTFCYTIDPTAQIIFFRKPTF